jgi:hypothetical protein
MLMRRVWLSFAALVLLSAVGCSDDEAPATLDLHGNWRLIAATYQGHQYDFTKSTSGELVIPQANLAVAVRGETQANTGCRTASVVVDVKGDDVSITVRDVGSMMTCLGGVADPMHGNYYKALNNVESGSISGDELTLSGPETTLTFRGARFKDG